MTTTDQRGNGRALELRPSVPAPGRLGQGTAVEQSRAVAEVHAAIVVAQQCPRNIARAVSDMQRSCAQESLAGKAFYSYKRGESQVSGETIQLARELARCWGNIQYGITELRRDDGYGQSEMQAWAWDVETNARSSTTFVVPHVRDTRHGAKALTDARDIYENNANMGARRLREMIFAILPGWYTEDAVAACYETLQGNPEDLPARIDGAVGAFAKIGVTLAQIEQRFGAPRPRWTAFDLAQLQVLYRSIMRRETTKEDEFGAPAAQRVTAEDITGTKPSGAAAPGPTAAAAAPAATAHAATAPTSPENSGPADPPAARATKAQTAELENLLAKFPWQDGDKAVFLKWRCGGDYRATKHQAAHLIAYLKGELDSAGDDPAEALSAIWAQYRAVREQAAAGEPDGGPGDQ